MLIANRIDLIKQNINITLKNCHRLQNSVTLLAVSKSQTTAAIRSAFQCGIINFGENYWQEAQEKIAQLHDLPITWHFIGPLQSNKVKSLTNQVSWVHCLDREKIALLLSKYRASHLPPLNLCIQVNLDHEKNKAGIEASQLLDFIQYVQCLPNLQVRGLMAIPLPHLKFNDQYQSFMRLTKL